LNPEYAALYLAKANEFNFKPADLTTEEGQTDAIRYLLTNGLIPITPENLKLAGEAIYIDGEKLPTFLVESLKASANARWDDSWDCDEEFEDEEHEAKEPEVVGAWFTDGQPSSVKIAQQRKITVTTVYYVDLEG